MTLGLPIGFAKSPVPNSDLTPVKQPKNWKFWKLYSLRLQDFGDLARLLRNRGLGVQIPPGVLCFLSARGWWHHLPTRAVLGQITFSALLLRHRRSSAIRPGPVLLGCKPSD